MISTLTPIRLLSFKVDERLDVTIYKIGYATEVDGSWIDCSMSPNDVEWNITEEQKRAVNAARQELTIAMMWLEMRIPERAICDYIATNHGNTFTHFASMRNELVTNADQFLFNKVRGWEDFERYERFYEVKEVVLNSSLQNNVMLKGVKTTKRIKQNAKTVKLNLESAETLDGVLGVYWYEFLRYHLAKLEKIVIDMVRDLSQKQASQLDLFDSGQSAINKAAAMNRSDDVRELQASFGALGGE